MSRGAWRLWPAKMSFRLEVAALQSEERLLSNPGWVWCIRELLRSMLIGNMLGQLSSGQSESLMPSGAVTAV